MKPIVALHRYSRNPNQNVVVAGIDENGEPIVKSCPERILPGAVFYPCDNAERDWLLSISAARPLTEGEMALFETGAQIEFPVDPFAQRAN